MRRANHEANPRHQGRRRSSRTTFHADPKELIGSARGRSGPSKLRSPSIQRVCQQRHEKWYDKKYGVTRNKCVWVKTHIATGTRRTV